MGASRRRILLIDDSASIRLAVRAYLEDAGFAVAEADSCAVALEQFGSQPPDAAVMDYMLPDGTALDLLP
jgi:DNA-binding response OmpR family regulator